MKALWRAQLCLLALPLVVSCNSARDGQPAAVPTMTLSRPEAISSESSDFLKPSPALPAEATAAPQPEVPSHEWPRPVPEKPALSRDPVNEAEASTGLLLEQERPPARDDLALAMAYRGLTTTPALSPEATSGAPELGSRQRFNIRSHISNEQREVEAELRGLSEHATFWFETSPGDVPSAMPDLETTVRDFDRVYEEIALTFGSETRPGIDGDPRIYIINVSSGSLCASDESAAQGCPLMGYVNTGDLLPAAVDPYSNEREMMVVNGGMFGRPNYMQILVHELRHLIEANYNLDGDDWEVEGSATLAEDLVGFSANPIARANQFLAAPDQQLNRWSDTNASNHYGQGYLLSRYLYDRLGVDMYRQIARHPGSGFEAIDAVILGSGGRTSGMELWLDWLVAQAIHEIPNVDGRYSLPEGVNTAAMQEIDAPPADVQTSVSQYAADYYRLPPGNVSLSFTGSNHARLLDVLPLSGERMWLANRANYSDARLTREFDLRGIRDATLSYHIYYALERGYDFAYVSLSTDGGRTWQALEGERMQSKAAGEDPSDLALTERFYTGDSGGWSHEVISLRHYAGQVVQIRFQTVTDSILTYAGIAIDDVSIPEVGFYDDAETNLGWQAEGWVRAAGYVPQQWHLQLITFSDGVPHVQHVLPAADQTLSLNLSASGSQGPRPILIISATAPMTLQPAYYRIWVS